MHETSLAGNYQAKRNHYDLLTIVIINLGKKHSDELHGLFRLLNAIFLDRMKPEDLKNLIENEYSIQITPSLEKGVDTMCNLSEGLVEDGIEEGMKKGMKKGMEKGEESATIRHLKNIMQKMHLTAEEAMDMFDIPDAKRPRYAELL